MKPYFAHAENAERKAYTAQICGCADLAPEFFYNQASYLAAEKSFLISVSQTYEMETIYELYDELDIPVPEKFQRKLADGEKKAWYEQMKKAHKKYGSAIQVRKLDPLYLDDISELKIDYFSGTYVTVPLGEGLINFCYADFDTAFEECKPGYLRFIRNPKSVPDLERKKLSGGREVVIRAFELYKQVFPTLSEVLYASLYTAPFPPLFMRKTEKAFEFYRQYLRLLQTEFLELIEFCFDQEFHPGVLGNLYPWERYSLWCTSKNRPASYERQEMFQADSFAPHGAKRPYGLSWDELDVLYQREIVLTEEQKAFAKEYRIEQHVLEASYHYPCFIASYYECSTVRDMLCLEFSKLLEGGSRFQKCKRCGRYFLTKGDYHGQYCERVVPGEGRTCQQLAAQETYQNKLKDNGGKNALNIYQKYYKRYFARVKAGSLKKERFKQWQYEAVQKRDDCLGGKLNVDEFATWLENSMPNRANKMR